MPRKIFAPDYYPAFHCIADKCRHTCCAGWEIDIDEDSLKKYQSMEDELGAFLRGHIDLKPVPHFRLAKGERCPLLRSDLLCELILQKGDSALCQICRDHPRFRNYWSDRVEIGLGLACEEAARVILSSNHPLRLIEIGPVKGEVAEPLLEDELWLMEYRAQMLAQIQEKGPAARLREYFIYRHLADAVYDGQLEKRLQFIDDACRALLQGWDREDLSALVERARAFSNEVEYDYELWN